MSIRYFKNLREQLGAWKQIRAMRNLVAAYKPNASDTRVLRRIVIVPSDPWTLVGAKGDEAMMQAVIQRLRKVSPDLEVAVITATPKAQEAAGALGFTALDAWSCSMSECISRVEAFGADSMIMLGADVMDGYYSPATTARMLLTAEAAARRGVHVSILGFSFNVRPRWQLRPVFDSLHASIAVNVRDRISYKRFQQFSSRKAQLVADAAFMLVPDTSAQEVQQVSDWANARRANGDVVLGINVHPMLIKGATPEQIAGLVNSTVAALRQLCKSKPVSLLLLSHDYRGHDGDDICLEPIAKALAAELGPRLLYPRTIFTAAQLKALAGCTDGVVSGRMHLAIACFGMERPVAALTYQDKFQGLFAHFEYPERFLLSPQGAADPAQLTSLMADFVDQLPTLTTLVKQKLPAVTTASALNLVALLKDR